MSGLSCGMPDYINDQIAKRLTSCGEMLGDFNTVIPTYEILCAILLLYDLSGMGR